MKKNLIIIVMVFCLTGFISGQDIHFSNAEFSPLVLNPALAGANSGLQANLSHRTQWGQLGESFRTVAASFDFRFQNKNALKTNLLAMGVNFFNDRIGVWGMNTNSVALSLVDHVRLNAKSQLSFALNAGYCQRSFQNPNGQWTSQYNGIAYNSQIDSGEDFNNQIFGFIDVGAGILYTYSSKVKAIAQNKDKQLNLGLAAYHLNRPNNSFVEMSSERLPIRYTAFVNAEISINGTDGVIMPGFYSQFQGVYSQYLFGAYYKYKFNSGSNYTGYERPFALSLGFFTRIKDAYIAKLMIDWDQFSFGYSYDFTYSTLTFNSNRLGANEIFVRFNVGDGGGFRKK